MIVPEHRGHGKSDSGDEKLSVPLMARDALALCRSLGVERAAAVGLSMGGMVAHALALDADDFVAALGIVDSTPSVPEPARSGLLAAAPLVRAGGMAAAAEYLAQSPATEGRDRRDLARTWRDLGSNDPLVTGPAEEAVAAAIPGARYPEIAGAGHDCNLDRPDEFDRVLTEFLDAVGYGDRRD